MTGRRRSPVTAATRRRGASGAIVVAVTLAACGTAPATSTGPPPWRAAHPDPSADVRFLDATGVCVITVRYPDAAPGEIVVEMSTFVQRDRLVRPTTPPAGRQVATSGDWSVIVVSPTDVQLLTSDALFDYRTASC